MGAVMKLGQNSTLNVESISTVRCLLIALGIGGVPKGRIIEFYGPDSSVRHRALHVVARAISRRDLFLLSGTCLDLFTRWLWVSI
jgi:RecA/RadA recombinase